MVATCGQALRRGQWWEVTAVAGQWGPLGSTCPQMAPYCLSYHRVTQHPGPELPLGAPAQRTPRQSPFKGHPAEMGGAEGQVQSSILASNCSRDPSWVSPGPLSPAALGDSLHVYVRRDHQLSVDGASSPARSWLGKAGPGGLSNIAYPVKPRARMHVGVPKKNGHRQEGQGNV